MNARNARAAKAATRAKDIAFADRKYEWSAATRLSERGCGMVFADGCERRDGQTLWLLRFMAAGCRTRGEDAAADALLLAAEAIEAGEHVK